MSATDGLIEIKGVRPSADVRKELAATGQPVLLAFSTGKDAMAAALALRDSGVEVVPYYLYYIPGNLSFIERSLSYFEDKLGQRIVRYPHPSIYRWLNALTFQVPERCAVIEAAMLPEPDYSEVIGYIKEDLGLPPATWVADGVRASDSPVRRLSFMKHGVMKPSNQKVSPVWDWRVSKVREEIAAAGWRLPVDYEWFGRSFDGLDYRFLEPLSRFAPDDYQKVLDWFPLAELELVRRKIGASQ